MAGGARFVTHNTLLAAFAAIFVSVFPTAIRAQALNACDLNSDGAVNIVDVQFVTNMTLGLSPCTANLAGAGVCNPVVVGAVKDAALSGKCVPHSVSLNWTASTSSNVQGYNVYRATQPSGTYMKLNSSPVAGTSYIDITVQAGQTYYYVATAVDTNNNESVYSNQASAVIPTT